jgi:hypothetical protein
MKVLKVGILATFFDAKVATCHLWGHDSGGKK